ncbi:MAG: hypothetical protein QXP70_03825 [Methanomassiliicoccales archaeon]
MRVLSALVLLLLLFPTLLTGVQHASLPPNLLNVIRTPDLQPGGHGNIEFMVYNTQNVSMQNIVLNLSIVSMATSSSVTPLTSIQQKTRPHFAAGGAETQITVGSLAPGAAAYLNVSVYTEAGTPHGSFFNTAQYEVATTLTFHSNGRTLKYASEGDFNSTIWDSILVFQDGNESINYTELNLLGYEGIIPMTSFGVNTPAPYYLIYAAAAASVVFAVAAFLYYRFERRSEEGSDKLRGEAPERRIGGKRKR